MKKTKSDRADLVPDVYVRDNGDYYGEVASAKPTAAANAEPSVAANALATVILSSPPTVTLASVNELVFCASMRPSRVRSSLAFRSFQPHHEYNDVCC